MNKVKASNVAMERVKSFVDRLEKMDEERKAIGGDIRDIYAEAKGNGFDVKTLRWLLSERKVDAAERDERDSLRAVYANALGMAVELVEVNGLSLRQAEKRTGISKSSIQRALTVPKASQPAPPHDADGVITETADDTPPGRSDGTSKDEGRTVAPAEPINESCGGGESRPADPCSDPSPRASQLCRELGEAGVAPGPQEPIEDDPAEEPAEWHRADVYQIEEVPRPDEIGAVAEAEPQRVAAPESDDLTPPAALLAKRREILDRRQKVSG